MKLSGGSNKMIRETFADKYLPAISIKEVFNRIQDEESRKIFLWRYGYFITRDENKMAEVFDLFGTVDIFGIGNTFSSVSIFGAGVLSEIYTIPFLEVRGIKINAVYDSNKAGQKIRGYDIVVLDEMLRENDKFPIIISTFSEHVCYEIQQILLSRGVKKEAIIKAESFIFERQYFDASIIKPQPSEVYIDAGCMDGDTILKFVEFTKAFGYNRIYGFEPDVSNYDATKNFIEKHNLHNVTLVQRGLWDSSDILNYSCERFGGSKISDSGETQIETIALCDAIDKNDKVTFIKMDIEGAELNALYGARELIKCDKPRLAICIYHKPEDVLYISAFILELNPEYKLFLRHYSPWPMYETVLYAV